MADVLAATPTGSTLSSTPPSSSLPASSSISLASRGVSGASIIQTAMKYIGYPYTATGNSPATGFSCIGFVSYVYRQNGIPLPGDLQDAYAYAPKVAFSNLEPGDILYFQNTVWPGISHAAIYLGGGRFIHSEWYGEGVKISSFTGDPVDYNYWIQKYLGANRPWTGATSDTVVAAATVATASTVTPTATPAPRLASGPEAVVSVESLNVRGAPGMRSGVQAVVVKGTKVVILDRSNGWYKVQLPNGVVGWIVGAGIGRSTVTSKRTASAPQRVAHGKTTSKHVAPTIGNPTAPTRGGASPSRDRMTAKARVDGLRVHQSPSTSAGVVTTLQRGQHIQVLQRSGNWDEVRLSDGTVGWASASYVSSNHSSQVLHSATMDTSVTVAAHTSKSAKSRTAVHMPQHSSLQVGVNVRTGPGMSSAVTTVIPPGGGYAVLGSSNGWMHVRLSDGQTGWVKASILGPGGQSNSHAAGRTQSSVLPDGSSVSPASTSPVQHVLTAGVRVHFAPGINSPVIGLAAAGTHLHILGQQGNWDHVHLSDGMTGYVNAGYVR